MTSGQQLALNPNISPDLTLGPSVAIQSRFHVIDGPQADLFRPDLLTSRPWVASTLMDRVGIRLDGKKEAHDIELPSEPCCFGAIQLTRDGTPIILGPDGPTIGGYPKIAVVISSELSALGQLKPGSPLTFEAVSFEEALSLNSAWEREFSRAVSQLRAGAES
jgi:allophanate hydrolase subunit 2